MLADTVDARDRLEFKGGINEWFGKDDMGCVYEIEARRMGAGVEEESFYLLVVSGESIEDMK